jgi:hypothetical protein
MNRFYVVPFLLMALSSQAEASQAKLEEENLHLLGSRALERSTDETFDSFYKILTTDNKIKDVMLDSQLTFIAGEIKKLKAAKNSLETKDYQKILKDCVTPVDKNLTDTKIKWIAYHLAVKVKEFLGDQKNTEVRDLISAGTLLKETTPEKTPTKPTTSTSTSTPQHPMKVGGDLFDSESDEESKGEEEEQASKKRIVKKRISFTYTEGDSFETFYEKLIKSEKIITQVTQKRLTFINQTIKKLKEQKGNVTTEDYKRLLIQCMMPKNGFELNTLKHLLQQCQWHDSYLKKIDGFLSILEWQYLSKSHLSSQRGELPELCRAGNSLLEDLKDSSKTSQPSTIVSNINPTGSSSNISGNGSLENLFDDDLSDDEKSESEDETQKSKGQGTLKSNANKKVMIGGNPSIPGDNFRDFYTNFKHLTKRTDPLFDSLDRAIDKLRQQKQNIVLTSQEYLKILKDCLISTYKCNEDTLGTRANVFSELISPQFLGGSIMTKNGDLLELYCAARSLYKTNSNTTGSSSTVTSPTSNIQTQKDPVLGTNIIFRADDTWEEFYKKLESRYLLNSNDSFRAVNFLNREILELKKKKKELDSQDYKQILKKIQSFNVSISKFLNKFQSIFPNGSYEGKKGDLPELARAAKALIEAEQKQETPVSTSNITNSNIENSTTFFSFLNTEILELRKKKELDSQDYQQIFKNCLTKYFRTDRSITQNALAFLDNTKKFFNGSHEGKKGDLPELCRAAEALIEEEQKKVTQEFTSTMPNGNSNISIPQTSTSSTSNIQISQPQQTQTSTVEPQEAELKELENKRIALEKEESTLKAQIARKRKEKELKKKEEEVKRLREELAALDSDDEHENKKVKKEVIKLD